MHYKKIIALRNNYSVIKEPSMEVKYIDNNNKILSYWRVDNDEKVVVVINLDEDYHSIDLEFPNNGLWEEKLSDTTIDIETNWYGDYNLSPLTSYVFTLPDNQCTPGDINLDGIINVADIVATINYILLGGELSSSELCAMDLNNDSNVNVGDIVALVNLILSL